MVSKSEMGARQTFEKPLLQRLACEDDATERSTSRLVAHAVNFIFTDLAGVLRRRIRSSK
jgi:hypothetical protein